MESGLDGRNNVERRPLCGVPLAVSMESGLDGRNNGNWRSTSPASKVGLNGVRPRWPEQCCHRRIQHVSACPVSMESGLDGRNNIANVGDILSTYEMSQWSPA